MSKELSDDDRLFDEAVDLMIRLQNSPDNPVAVEMSQRWRGRSQAHEAAWTEAAEIHGMTGKVLSDQYEATQPRLMVSRRTFMVGGAVAIGGALASYKAPDWLLQIEADYTTATAEVRRIPLPDGTMVTLGPESAMALRFDARRRHLDLLKGMGFFEVARDEKRPFSVQTGSLISTALGTAFDVSADSGFVTVSVDHGLVGVRSVDMASRSENRVSGGEWITLGESDGTVSRGNREMDQIGAWRSGTIVAEKEPISAVIARIARWSPARIVMIDPSLGNKRISGVFDLHNPVMALQAVVHPYGSKVRRISPYLTVISPV